MKNIPWYWYIIIALAALNGVQYYINRPAPPTPSSDVEKGKIMVYEQEIRVLKENDKKLRDRISNDSIAILNNDNKQPLIISRFKDEKNHILFMSDDSLIRDVAARFK